MSEGWPDFWIRGKKIDLIDLINTVNLIKKIEEIETITNISTIDRVNTVGTIEKINPTETENVVIDRIAKIDEVTSLDTINTINTIQKIKNINEMQASISVPSLIKNPDFETGDFTGWRTAGTVEITTDAYIGQYAAKIHPGSSLYQKTVLVTAKNIYVVFSAKSDVENDEVSLRITYMDDTVDTQTFALSLGYALFKAIFSPSKAIRRIDFRAPSYNSGAIYIDNIRVGYMPEINVYQAEKDRTISREGTITHFSVSATAAGSTTIYTPSSGKKAKVLAWNFYVDADVVCELRFSTSGNVIAGLSSKGATAMNLIGLDAPTGDTDETIEIYVSDAANVKGWINIVEV